jgi:putative transcriptional regulator
VGGIKFLALRNGVRDMMYPGMPDMQRKTFILTVIGFFLLLNRPWETVHERGYGPGSLFAQQWSPFQMKPARGAFLVSAEKLIDPNFSETVVILLEYSSEGAMGLVINRPTKLRLSEVFPDIRSLRRRRDKLYAGGPVGMEQLVLLVRSSEEPEDSYQVFGDVYVCSLVEELERIVKGGDPYEDFRTYAGYSGWAPGQLDSEVRRGDWHIMKADAESIFSPKPENLWQEFIEKTKAQWTKGKPSYSFPLSWKS